MKNISTIVTTLIIGAAFVLGACGKKDAAKAEAPKTEPAAATETKPADPAAAGETKPEEKKEGEKAGGGW